MGKREDFIVFLFPLHILSLHSKSTLCVVCFFLIYLFFNRLCPGSGRFLKCVATAMKSSYFFRLKFDSFMALRPGEGPEGVQLYIRFVKATPPRNGVRLHLTFLRLATLVGIGHEIATPWALPRVSKPCGNGILNEMENNALYSRLRFQKTINNLTCAKNKKKINHPPISP